MKADKPTPEMSQAMSRLTLTNVFFTALLYGMKFEQDSALPFAAATDGVTLIYNPEQFRDDFTPVLRVSVLVHELLHVIMYHSLRRGIRDPKLWNIACDMVCNMLLVEYGFPIGKDWIQPVAKYAGWSAEKVYDDMLKDAKSKPQSGQGQPGEGDGQPEPGGPGMDVRDYKPENGDGKSAAEVERDIGVNTEKACQAAKAAGNMPAGMKRMFEEAQVQREPWHSHLRRFFTSLNARQYNWSRINKRHAVLFGTIAPDMRVEQMGEIVVGVDCSGSITPRQLGSMASHLSDICNECAPKKVTVMYFDSKVSHVDEYEGPVFDIKLVPHGGGGTDFRPVFDKTESEYPDAQVVIMMTDMYGPWGAGCSKEVVWVTQTETINPSFGEIIHADFNE